MEPKRNPTIHWSDPFPGRAQAQAAADRPFLILTSVSRLDIEKEKEGNMKKNNPRFIALAVMLAAAVLSGGCSKKAATVAPVAVEEPKAPPKATPPPVPKITLSASPTTIERGQSSSLSWSAENAASLRIDPGIGNVELSGNRNVSPGESTTYEAVATGPGGTSSANVRLTVTSPAVVTKPQPLSDAEYVERNIKDIFFDYDMYNIRDDARNTLIQNAKYIAERPHLRMVIEGHCDDRGSSKYNLALGDRRAVSVLQFLVSQGVDEKNFDTISYGEERPFAEGNNENAWSQNRRAHFVLKNASR